MFRIIFRIDGGQAVRDYGDIGFGLRNGEARLEVAEDVPIFAGFARGLRVGGAGLAGDPNVGVAPAEARGHDAD